VIRHYKSDILAEDSDETYSRAKRQALSDKKDKLGKLKKEKEKKRNFKSFAGSSSQSQRHFPNRSNSNANPNFYGYLDLQHNSTNYLQQNITTKKHN